MARAAIAGVLAGIILGACGLMTYQLTARVSVVEANVMQIAQWINAQQPAQKAPQNGGETK